MYYYKAFDICVQSEIQIPQFICAENERPDVSVRFGEVRATLPSDFGDDHALRTSENEFCFFWDEVGWYSVRNGREIILEPYPGAEEKLLRLPLIGIAFAALLQQRGILVLHASAVSVGREAVVFLGWKGAGKSTTAAMLYGRGHTMISDDIVAIVFAEDGRPHVLPGFPHFKLMPESATSVLGDDPETLSQVYTGAQKRYRSSSDNFLQESVALKAIYQLSTGEDIQISDLKPQQAVSTLIANTYLARYGKELLQDKYAVANLRQCADLVSNVPVYQLERPKSFERLDSVAEILETRHMEVSSVNAVD